MSDNHFITIESIAKRPEKVSPNTVKGGLRLAREALREAAITIRDSGPGAPHNALRL